MALPFIACAHDAKSCGVGDVADGCKMAAQIDHGQPSGSVASWGDHADASQELAEKCALVHFKLTKVAVIVDVSVNEFVERIKPNADAILRKMILAIYVALVGV